ncbi:hypothetical protein AZH43_11040 [Acinetobacter pragensis]|uniref:Uncharacterized protein n=1 Tax=Acinetobacter pragensis TaxID=1806892 RepID=A0A151Y2R1_9GAMM|nr:hypothetical protein AZH43_11040 [Acinetobacter pragensis]
MVNITVSLVISVRYYKQKISFNSCLFQPLPIFFSKLSFSHYYLSFKLLFSIFFYAIQLSFYAVKAEAFFCFYSAISTLDQNLHH